MKSITKILNPKTIKLGLILFTIGILSFACSSDDDSKKSGDTPYESYFKYEGQIYEIKGAAMIVRKESEGNEGYNSYYVEFYTSTLAERTNNYPIPNDNIYSYVDFSLYSPEETDYPKKGVYTYVFGGNIENNELAFEEAGITINENFETGRDEYNGEATLGTAEVKKGRNPFEIDFYFVTYDGKEVQGHYKGKPIIVDGDVVDF